MSDRRFNRALRTLRPAALLLVGCCGCRPDAPAPSDASRVSVFVGIPPTAYFVQCIGGSRIEVDVLIAAGRSPHAFEPAPRQMAALARARLFFAVGMPFEQRLASRIAEASGSLEIVDATAGIERRRMTPSGRDSVESDRHEGAADPHVWLDPRLAKTQARNICDALQRVDPDNAEEYRRNLAALEADLDRLHARLTKALSPHAGARILVFHPAYGYFTDAYGLQQMAVEIEGKPPSGRALASLIDRARAAAVQVLFVQPQNATGTAEAIAMEIGAKIATLDPLAGDYIANMDAMAAAIGDALK